MIVQQYNQIKKQLLETFPNYSKLYLRIDECVFGGRITIKITFTFEAIYDFERTILRFVFCKLSNSGMLVLQFLKS